MEMKEIKFRTEIQGVVRDWRFVIPVENGYAITNEFCPKELLTGGMEGGLVDAINGETLQEFVEDCKLQIRGMHASAVTTPADIHMDGLAHAVVTHIAKCGRLIFGDLLIYVDCFSHLLKADGFTDAEIRRIYPQVTKTLVDACPEFVKNSISLAPLKQTPMYEVLSRLV